MKSFPYFTHILPLYIDLEFCYIVYCLTSTIARKSCSVNKMLKVYSNLSVHSQLDLILLFLEVDSISFSMALDLRKFCLINFAPLSFLDTFKL